MNEDALAISRRKIVFAASFGNFLEFFDFTVFTSFVLIIGEVFFPSANPTATLMKSLAVFGAAFFMRPVGGVVIGYYADKFGRRSAMILTLSLMTISTLGIACAPGYATAGIWGAVMLVFARLLQGFAAGGEVGASTSMLVESAPSNRRGLYSSWQLATQGASTMFGGLLAMALNSYLPTDAMHSWGWRVPFLIGASLGPVGLYLRLQIESATETVHKAPFKNAGDPVGAPSTWSLLRQYAKEIAVGILMLIGGTITIYLTYYFYATISGRFLGIAQSYTGAAIALAGFLSLVLSPIAGYMSDLYGRKPIILYTRLALLILAVPSYWLLSNNPSPVALFLTVGVMSGLTSFGAAPQILMISEVFPRAIRALAFSLVYAASVAIFGGYAQFFATWLIDLTGSILSPAIYLMAGCVATLLSLCFIKDEYKSELK